LHGIALAELIAYIDEAHTDEVSPVFRLADLGELYSARLKQLGLEKLSRIHSTRLKERILAHLPGIRAHSEGRDVLLAFDTDVGHEEADTRIFVHMADAVKEGLRSILIRTVDTDVVVLAIAAVARLQTVTELWIAFGTGTNFRYIPVHSIAAALGTDKSLALPMFHAFSGCDTVSSFATIGKKTAWDTWKTFSDVTATFLALSRPPPSIDEDHIKVLERFTILMYERTSSCCSIDEARMALFTKRNRTMFTIPPTRGALLQHAKRAVYQGGHTWGQLFATNPVLPCPSDWGWTDAPNWKPLWTTLPEASIASRQLVRCGCQKSCKGNCTCKKAALLCTALCQCSGQDCL